MIMPGRSWVAGIAIAGLHLLLSSLEILAAGSRLDVTDPLGWRTLWLPPRSGPNSYSTQGLRSVECRDWVVQMSNIVMLRQQW
jgi:hypothetical protein